MRSPTRRSGTGTPNSSTSGSTAGQHPSHEKLLVRDVALPDAAALDAIIVPTARAVSMLDHAVSLAMKFGCPLVVLCSRRADAAAALDRARGTGVAMSAADFRGESFLPRFRTTELLRGQPVRRTTDTADKRNLGLAVGRMLGWRRVLFLDDDIREVDAGLLAGAAALLDHHDAVGLENTGFEDNSVVCHANRATGGDQGTFVGGGALLIPAARNISFFPHIYNEDWFFLLNGRRIGSVAVGGVCEQQPFNPYADPDRARQEEFGDCLAEGMFSLLDNGREAQAATAEFWAGFLRQRHDLITSIRDRVPTAPRLADHKHEAEQALAASLRSLETISPGLCVTFLAKWRRDRMRWRQFLTTLPSMTSAASALTYLGVPARSLPGGAA
ncbi:hypothetical protein AB0368_20085 [Actinoplanes sp. NPDC051475]|uniref:hypothetical protein n=1 Tax=Actinoplanes sp. NPDC051475 TaxID=3157225 RepID=UPI00344E6040